MPETRSTSTTRSGTLYDVVNRAPQTLLPLVILLLPAAASTFASSSFLVLTLALASALLILSAAAWTAALWHNQILTRPATIAGLLFGSVMLVAFFASPSGRGAILTFTALAGSGIVLATSNLRMPDLRRLVAVPLLATSSLQALLVLTQTLTDRPIGLSLIEPGAELETIDGLLRSQGTLNHVYETAALSLLAVGVAFITVPDNSRWRTAWIVAAALAGSTVGLTHSRAAVLSVLLMIPFIALTVRMHDRGALQVGGAFLIGLTIAAAFTSSAWALRGDQSTSGDLDDISLGRITLATQALEMAVDHPLVGVGPGLYMETLEQRYETDQRYPFMVHNVSLAVAAENGIPAAILASFFCGWAMLRAIRSGPTGALLALSLVGFLLFDVLHYDRPVGLLMTAIWLGVLQNVDGQVTSRRVRSS